MMLLDFPTKHIRGEGYIRHQHEIGLEVTDSSDELRVVSAQS